MTIEDRLREAGRAVTEQVRELPELTLQAAAEGAGSGARRRRRRSWPTRSGWLIPLTAAAAVIAVAGALVATRTLHTSADAGPAASPSASENDSAAGSPNAVPRYFVAIPTVLNGIPGIPGKAMADVVDSRAGKLLDKIAAPEDGSFAEVGGGADDRTFVLADSLPTTSWDRFDLYLLRLVPDAAHPAQLAKLPIKTVTGIPAGIAVAPDGREVAVASVFSNKLTLRVYSLPSGTVLGTWTTHGNAVGALGVPDSTLGLSWLADGRRLAFSIVEEPGFGWDPVDVRTLNVTQPSGDLLADSRLALRLPGTQTATESGPACTTTLLTPDGGTVVCGKYASIIGCVTDAPGLVSYSVATGGPARLLYSYRGKCVSGFEAIPLWVNQSARDVIALVQTEKRQLGLLANGRMTWMSYPFFNGDSFGGSGDIAF
jgi:hypothetical protein